MKFRDKWDYSGNTKRVSAADAVFEHLRKRDHGVGQLEYVEDQLRDLTTFVGQLTEKLLENGSLEPKDVQDLTDGQFAPAED